MKVIKEWWRITFWEKKPQKGVPRRHEKTIRDFSQIKDNSFLQSLPLGWHSISYGARFSNGRLKCHKIRTWWQIKTDTTTGKKIGEKWVGLIGEMRFLTKIKI